MIDLHSHILANLDDGPRDTATSLSMAAAWAREEVRTVAATPHVNLDYAVDAATAERAVSALNAELAELEIPVEVIAGGEVGIEGLERLSSDELHRFALGASDCLLLESPLSSNTSSVEEAVFRLQLDGFRVLLAHPERCPLFLRDTDRLRRLVQAGALCSITAGSMAGQFGSRVREFTIELFEQGLVHNVASDAHDDVRRPPGLRSGFVALEDDLPGLSEHAAWFTATVPAALLEGTPVPSAPPAPTRRRARRGLLRRLRSGR